MDQTESDPVLREVQRLQAAYHRSVRNLVLVSILMFVVLAMATALSIYLNESNINEVNRKNNEASVRNCFQGAATRPQIRRAISDKSLSPVMRDFVRILLIQSPTVSYCQKLAKNLDVERPSAND